MKRIDVRSYTREGGAEFVNAYSRNDPRMIQAAFAAVKAVKDRLPEKPVQLRNLKSEKNENHSPSHLTAESLAVATYNPNNAALPSGYQLAETITDPRTGLAVSVFVAPGKQPVVSFRGTEAAKDVRDIMTDVDPRGIGFGQFESNKQKLAAIAAKYPGATVTGHSLGGALAQRYAAEFGNAGEVVTFNSPGIDKRTAAKFKGGTKVTHYVSEGDPVSLGGEKFIDGTAKVVSFKSGKTPIIGNTIDKHMATITAGLLGNPDATVKTITAQELSNPNFRYGSARATGSFSRGFVENNRKGIGVVTSPLQPVVQIAGAALGKFGIGV